MNNVEIVGLQRLSKPQPQKGGSLILAHFDCRVNGFRLARCALARTPKGGLTIWPPRLDNPRGGQSYIVLEDAALREDMTKHALAAYQALGGVEAD